jgi:IclR-like helix-turn-helix domain-containing protein
MPRPSQQSRLRAPLNEMLGTEANVRLLRVLTLAGTSLTAGEVAQRAGLGRTGVYPALAALEAAGIIEYVGVGAQRQVRFRDEHPLGSPIASLFRAEADRLDSLVDQLRSVFRSLPSRRVLSAWLEGTALTERVTPEPLTNEDFMTCYLVAEAKSLSDVTIDVQSQLPKLERRFDVNIELVGMTRSEITTRLSPEAFRDPVLLGGVPPVSLLDDSATKSARQLRNRIIHEQHDDSARRLAQAIALRLQKDPSLQRAAVAHIQKRIRRASKQEQLELKEWVRLLSLPAPMLHRFLVDPSPRATRLRQSLPALGLLTPAEREAVLRARSEEELKEIATRGVKRRRRDA